MVVIVITITTMVYLVFVGGVERNLTNLLVLFAEVLHVTNRQLDTLQQGRLRGVAIALTGEHNSSHNKNIT